MRPLRIYVAGPYTAPTREQVDVNIARASEATAVLLRKGHYPFSPINMTAHFDELYPDIDKDTYIKSDLKWLELCDAILLLPGWQESEGAKLEYKRAEEMGLTMYFHVYSIPEACEE